MPGVTTFISIGGEVRQYRVTPNPLEMHHLKVSSDKILDALRRFGTNSSGGFLDQQSREYLVRNVGLTTSLEDLRNTVVDTHGGRSILLRQVASVDFAPRVKRGRCRIQRQAGRDRFRSKATGGRHARADAANRTRAVRCAKNHAAGRQDRSNSVPAGDLHRDVDRQPETGPGRSGDRGCLRAHRVSRQCPRNRHLAHSHSDLDSLHRDRISSLRVDDQHNDARWARHRHRRAGRRRRRRRREHPAQAEGECTAGAASPGARGHRRGKPGGALGHRLRHLHHHPGIPAALRAVGDRRPAVHAAWHRLRGLDRRLARHLDHGYARSQLLPAARECDPALRSGQKALSCAP